MGGVRSTGMSIECDRCKKLIPVSEKEHEQYYEAFASREDQGEHMFQALQLRVDGKNIDAAFEFLCPKCDSAVATYMDKILMVKETKKDETGKDEGKDEKKETKAKETKAKETKAKETKPQVQVADETNPPPDTEPGMSFDEQEMFVE